MPYLSKIYLYPFKSLDGINVEQSTVLASGALQGDRTFALVDEQGFYINGKRNAKVHQLRTFFDFRERIFVVQGPGDEQKALFHIDSEQKKLENWFSAYFGISVSIKRDDMHGFPDDTKAPGPTLIGESTLEQVATWFPGVDVTTFKLRFRANLEIADADAFWEDRLYGEAGAAVQFRVGDVQFEGINPCQRCVVPSRDPFSGETYPLFQKTFIERRKDSLPEWTMRSRFNHFYRLALNTCISWSQAGKILRVGDQMEVLKI